MNETIEENVGQTTAGPSAWRLLLFGICVFGIALNLIVFGKRRRSTKRQISTTRISLRLLSFMAIADTISLAALLLMLSIGVADAKSLSHEVMSVICKVDLFLIHSASAFSVWCWLIMSAVRYIAIYRPYTHLRLNKEPMFAVGLVVTMCALFELWILINTTYAPEVSSCVHTLPPVWDQRLNLAEIVWSYFLPLILITILDLRVLCCHSVWSSQSGAVVVADTEVESTRRSEATIFEQRQHGKSSAGTVSIDRPAGVMSPSMSFASAPGDSPTASTTLPNINGYSIPLRNRTSGPIKHKTSRRAQQMRILKRCLAIAILDLGMNLPDYVYRLYLSLAPSDESTIDQVPFIIEYFSQFLYFTQFALNALYLMGIIYVAPRKKAKSTGYTFHSIAKSVAQ